MFEYVLCLDDIEATARDLYLGSRVSTVVDNLAINVYLRTGAAFTGDN
jgi:hypothetical protein